MKKARRKIQVGIVSTYPDKKDCIYEYVTDLVAGINANDSAHCCYKYYPVKTNLTLNSKLLTFDLRTIDGFCKLAEKIKNDEIDILHFHYGSTFLGFNSQLDIIQHVNFYYFLKKLKIPIVITAHMYFEHETSDYKSLKKFFTKMIAKLPLVALVVHTEKQQDELINIAKTTKKFFYIPHGFPNELLLIKKEEEKIFDSFKQLRDTKNKIILSTLGLIAPWKGTLEIIKLVSPIIKNNHGSRYLIIGSSMHSREYFNECKEFVKKQQLDKKIILIDKFLTRAEMKSIMHNTDIYLAFHSSHLHSSSGTITFALATGCPVVTNDIQFVQDKSVSSALVVCKTAEEYFQMTQKLILDKKLRQDLKKKNKQIVAKLNWNTVAKKYIQLFGLLQKEKKSLAKNDDHRNEQKYDYVIFLKPISLGRIIREHKPLFKISKRNLLVQTILPPMSRFYNFYSKHNVINRCTLFQAEIFNQLENLRQRKLI